MGISIRKILKGRVKQMKNKFGIMIAAFAIFVMIGVICILSAAKAVQEGYTYQIFDFSFGKKAELRNTIELSTSEVSSLKLDYGSRNIVVYSTSDDKITIKEFLYNDRPENMASVTYEENNQVTVTGGNVRTIVFFSFGIGGEKVEVYIPHNVLSELSIQSGSGNITGEQGGVKEDGDITVTSGSGNIRWKDMAVKEISLQAGSGNINLADLKGDISIQTGSGNISGDSLSGNVSASAGSGNITLTEFAGGGKITAKSGNLKVEASQVDSDIRMQTGSGNIKLAVPKNLQFHLEIQTGSGNIHTDFDEVLSYNKKGNNAQGDVGSEPDISISLEANSGNVKLSE